MLIVKIIENNTMYSAQELHFFLCIFPSSANVIPAIFSSSIFSVHSLGEMRSNNLSTNFFLHLQIL